jgi:hypothetical protein
MDFHPLHMMCQASVLIAPPSFLINKCLIPKEKFGKGALLEDPKFPRRIRTLEQGVTEKGKCFSHTAMRRASDLFSEQH